MMLSVEALFLQASNFNYYGSKEEGEESRQEGSKEEEGINPFLPQNKNSPCGSFCFSGLSYLGHNLFFVRIFVFSKIKDQEMYAAVHPLIFYFLQKSKLHPKNQVAGVYWESRVGCGYLHFMKLMIVYKL